MNHPARPTRCATVWLLATTAAAGLLALLLPLALPMSWAAGRGDLGGRPFEDLLVGFCAAVAVPATCWLWAVTTVTTLEAARGAIGHEVPHGVRRLVLAACGVALTGGLAASAATPALADTPQAPPADLRASAIVARVVNGLPLPDRATTTTVVAARPVRQTTTPGRDGHVTVHRGDTLWGIAARDLAPGASDADINTHWQAIYAANRGVIGADPGLIHPDQQLRLPRA